MSTKNCKLGIILYNAIYLHKLHFKIDLGNIMLQWLLTKNSDLDHWLSTYLHPCPLTVILTMVADHLTVSVCVCVCVCVRVRACVCVSEWDISLGDSCPRFSLPNLATFSLDCMHQYSYTIIAISWMLLSQGWRVYNGMREQGRSRIFWEGG